MLKLNLLYTPALLYILHGVYLEKPIVKLIIIVDFLENERTRKFCCLYFVCRNTLYYEPPCTSGVAKFSYLTCQLFLKWASMRQIILITKTKTEQPF